MKNVSMRYIGGPTSLLEYGTARILIDPTFDDAQDYPLPGRKLTKTHGPTVQSEDMGRVDVVLVSHDQHPDNLDNRGREFALSAPLVLSTKSAEERLDGNVRGLEVWEQYELQVGDQIVTVTAVPAHHGPEDLLHKTGEVTGFVLQSAGLPTVYVSGDNASLKVVRQIAERFPAIDIAVIFAGGAKTPLLGEHYLTLSSDMAAEAATILNAKTVVPLHFEQWAHFTEGKETLKPAFARYGIEDRLVLLPADGSPKTLHA
jgi:L-ascorbate metabolism protein UlaG (beta-lactamase superfamily)